MSPDGRAGAPATSTPAQNLLRAEQGRRREERARNGPTRDCHHPVAQHAHGTRAAYVRDRCRCAACRRANADAYTNRHRDRTYGRWRPFIDAAPVRAHIHQLRQARIGIDQIAKLADTSDRHVRDLIGGGRSGKPAIRRVRPDTAQRILRIKPIPANRAPRSTVDATGTRRRLQALGSMGWPNAWLAAELHRSVASLHRSMTSRSVTAATAAQVDALYERLWDTSPRTTTRGQRAAVERTRRYARERGWRPGLAWDDIDTDPDTGPAPDPDHPQTAQTNRHTEELDEIAIERAISGDLTVPLTRAEEAEVTRRLTAQGCSIRTIADLLGTTTRTVSRHRKQSSAA